MFSETDYFRIKNKVALVTGGSRGIGREISVSLANFGVNVIVCDIREEEKRLMEELASSGGRPGFYQCDVTNPIRIHQMVSDILEQYGAIDILVNNAGIGSRMLPMEEITDDEWDSMIKTDLTAPFYLCREIVPVMKKNKYGKIINLSSGSGVIGCEFCSHYASAKAGLIGFTQSIAKELAAYRINANAIAVPTTDTLMLRETGFDDDLTTVEKEIPWGRIGTPKDIANMVLYLASDASEYVTGQVLAPNGGRRTPM